MYRDETAGLIEVQAQPPSLPHCVRRGRKLYAETTSLNTLLELVLTSGECLCNARAYFAIFLWTFRSNDVWSRDDVICSR